MNRVWASLLQVRTVENAIRQMLLCGDGRKEGKALLKQLSVRARSKALSNTLLFSFGGGQQLCKGTSTADGD